MSIFNVILMWDGGFMLEIRNIHKVYKTDNFKQTALENVSLNFRKSEFVSILGASGSGKTTLLNIIGGLDKYTSGDLIINGVSTKKYTDRDWDTYRNHKIGFVFQSYNLISHQSVLSNVELALTLSGVSSSERKEKAKEVLKKVGLEKHINKRPNQLSGGQMQRVAIARALINNPDIILADEPTGALDSETSKQIMDILKQISKNKLVIMVTHNPDLAKEYSSRIIKLKDGKVIDDSNPYKETKKENKDNIKVKKTSMSYLTALSLSFNNLMLKKKRTILVSFAGSIGIIGIALILSLSNGFQKYIDKLQEDTLTSYPLMITKQNADMTSMLLSMVSGDKNNDSKADTVTEKQYMTSMFSSVSANNLKGFKNYLEENYNKVKEDISSIKYNYGISPLIYTYDASNNLAKLNPSTMMNNFYSSSASSMISTYSSVFSQMIDDQEMLEKQYDLLKGKWPENYDEMIIVLSEPNTISDMLVYSLGLRDTNELNTMISKMMAGEEINIKNEPMTFTYDDLMNIDLKLIMATDLYKYNSKYNIYEDMSEDKSYMKDLYKKSTKLKIVGIVSPKEGNNSMALNPGVAYTSKLVDYIIEESGKTQIVQKQLKNKDMDVFSNTKFDSKKTNSNLDFQDLIKVDTKKLQSAFNMKIDEKTISSLTSNYMEKISNSISTDTSKAYTEFNDTLIALGKGLLESYVKNPLHVTNDIPVIYMNDIEEIVDNYFNLDITLKKLSSLEENYLIPKDVYLSTYKSLITGMIQGYIATYNSSDQSFSTDLNNLGAPLFDDGINDIISNFVNQAVVIKTGETFAKNMTEAVIKKQVLTEVGNLTGELMNKISSSFNIDTKKIASAFSFDLSEEQLKRIMTAMSSSTKDKNATTNLSDLGYQDKEDPTAISFYFNSFNSKENFLKFIDNYNAIQEKNENEDDVINYTDTTGILMSSVKKIVDSVSYVLIAFVSISLVVSSIMIGIITYISVLERTKEIGILRAIGASKKNISSIFNAETFIIGLLSGVMGIGVTMILIIPINQIIHKLTDNVNLNAILPYNGAIILIVLAIILTLIGGLIPAKMASKKDPVEALRTE